MKKTLTFNQLMELVKESVDNDDMAEKFRKECVRPIEDALRWADVGSDSDKMRLWNSIARLCREAEAQCEANINRIRNR